mgnify:CR=1 FL=1
MNPAEARNAHNAGKPADAVSPRAAGPGAGPGPGSPAVLLCVGGGISAYKSAALCSSMVQGGWQVRVAMTAAACRFIQPLTFAALSGRQVATDLWQQAADGEILHLSLTRDVRLIIVAPATANLLAKFAWGLADELVSAAILGADCPILLAPAMNQRMWASPATQHNVRLLGERGFHFVGPASGWLAERESGTGRMSEPAEILSAARALLPG